MATREGVSEQLVRKTTLMDMHTNFDDNLHQMFRVGTLVTSISFQNNKWQFRNSVITYRQKLQRVMGNNSIIMVGSQKHGGWILHPPD